MVHRVWYEDTHVVVHIVCIAPGASAGNDEETERERERERARIETERARAHAPVASAGNDALSFCLYSRARFDIYIYIDSAPGASAGNDEDELHRCPL